MKNKELKIKNDLQDLLTNNEELEYVLYGKLAPQTKRILIIFCVWIIFMLTLLFKIIPIDYYLIVLITVLFIISYVLFYQSVYLGKFGKHLYIHEFGVFNLNSKKDKVLVRNAEVIEDRTSDFHLTIKLILNHQEQFIIFRNNSVNKGYPNQTTNIKKLIADINKKHKK